MTTTQAEAAKEAEMKDEEPTTVKKVFTVDVH